MPTLRRIAAPIALAVALSVPAPPAARGQAVAVDVSDGATHRFEIAGPVRVVYTGSSVTITWGAQPAPPIPIPTPPPIPQPAPAKPGKLFVTYIWDPSRETSQAARMRADLATSGEWEAMGVEFRALAHTDKQVDARGLRAQIGKLPCVIVQRREDGDPRAPVVSVMASVDSMAAVVEAVGRLKDGR